jgi:MraZ protein
MGKFLGQYNPSITEGSRIALPKKIRKHIRGREVVLSKGFDKCIFVYDKNDWMDAARRKVETPRGEVSTEELERYLYTSATEASVDSQGRIVLPSDLIEFAELSSKTAVLGVGDHVELWDLDNWNAYLKRVSNKLIASKE